MQTLTQMLRTRCLAALWSLNALCWRRVAVFMTATCPALGLQGSWRHVAAPLPEMRLRTSLPLCKQLKAASKCLAPCNACGI